MYGVPLNTYKNWLKDYESDGRIKSHTWGHIPQSFSEDEKQKIHDMILQKSDITLEEIRAAIGKNCSLMAVHRELVRQGFKYKKKLYLRLNNKEKM